jgi:hypothetical protein
MGREPSQIQSPLISAEQRAAEALRTEQLRAILRQTQAQSPRIGDLKLPEFMGENVPMSDPRLQNMPVVQAGPAEFVGPGASPELSDPMLQNVPVQRPQRPPVLGESPNVRPGPALRARTANMRPLDVTLPDVTLPARTMPGQTMIAPTMDANTQIPKLDPMTQRMPSEALTRNAGGPPNRPMPPSPGAGQSLLSILGGLATGMGAVETKRHLEQGRWQEALATGIPTGTALAAARGIGGAALRAAAVHPVVQTLVQLGWPQGTATGAAPSELPPDHPQRIEWEQGQAKLAEDRAAKLAEDRAINSARQSEGVRRATRTDDGSDPNMRTFRMAPLTPGEEPAPGAMLNPDFFGPAPKKPAPRPAPRRTAPTPAARTSVGVPSWGLGDVPKLDNLTTPDSFYSGRPESLGVPALTLGNAGPSRKVLRPDANESEVSSDDPDQSLMDIELRKQLKRQMGGAVTRPGFSGRGPDNLPFYPR